MTSSLWAVAAGTPARAGSLPASRFLRSAMPGLLVLVAMLMTCAASADHAAMAVEVKALVEHGYDQARHDGEGGPPPLPSLRAAAGSETVDRLVAAIARPAAAGPAA